MSKKNIFMLIMMISVQLIATDLQQYSQLKSEIEQLDRSYYDKGVSLISDTEYDKLLIKFKNMEQKLFPNKTAQLVRENQLKGKKIKHQTFIGSLNKVRSLQELDKWLTNQPENSQFIVQPKIDGMSVVCHYRNGKLVSAATRGDGRMGNDILSMIPRKYVSISSSKNMTLRGEIFVTKKDFISLSKQFTTPRSATVAIVRSENRALQSKLSVRFFQQINSLKSDSKSLRDLTEAGCSVIDYQLYSREEIINNFDQICDRYQNNTSDNDGFVVKVDTINKPTTSNPDWAVAFKFPSCEKWTTLTNIDWQASVHGRLKPVAIFTPVCLDANKISRATLNNWQNIKNKNISLGCKLKITRAGKTIPKITEIESTSHAQPLDKCPFCNQPVKVVQVDLVCGNDHCPAVLKKRVAHFFAKGSVYVPGVNKTVINALINELNLTRPAELYQLDDAMWTTLLKQKGIGSKTITKIKKGLEKSKATTLPKILIACAIPKIGHASASKFNCDNLRDLGPKVTKQLKELQGLGFTSLDDAKLTTP